MKLLLSILGFLLVAAWLVEMAIHRRDREIGERRREQERENLRHITGSARKWWKEPDERGDDDLGDH